MAAAFPGLDRGTVTFLVGLERNNRKAWFEAHRADYDAHYVGAGKALVAALGPRLRKIAPSVQFDPRVNGSVARVHRDVRFAKDKSPYKAHLDLWFWHGERRGWEAPGFFFRLTPKQLIVGVGMHMFTKEQLPAFRDAVVDATKGRALAATVAKVRAAGYEVGGAKRKTVPRGYDTDHARAALLLHEGLYASWEGPIPKEAYAPKFPDWCAAHFRAQWPIAKWVLANV
jgi:uncharacterized protein (TIGR02453 family)